MLKSLVMPILKRAAKPYVAGDTIEDALDIAASAKRHGYGVTICYWQAADESPDATARRYFEAMKEIRTHQLDAHIAVKVPALAGRNDLLSDVIGNARRADIPVSFDSHGIDNAAANLDAAAHVGADRVGCCIPGRWKRSLVDAERAIKLGLRVRVVKGNWAASEDEEHGDIDEGYLGVIDRLAGRCREVGVATHDPALACEAMARLKAAGTPFVQELLYGLPIEPVAAEGRRHQAPTRIYIPYGEAWFPYSAAAAIRRPETIMRLASDIFRPRAAGIPAPGD